MPEDLRQALDKAVAAIVEIAHPELIILFGSWAEGTARLDSDVDLLVVAETENPHQLTVALRKAIRPSSRTFLWTCWCSHVRTGNGTVASAALSRARPISEG